MPCNKSDGCKERAKIAERNRIVELIKCCAESYDPDFDKDVPNYLRQLAARIRDEDI